MYTPVKIIHQVYTCIYLMYYFYVLPFYMVLCTIEQVLLHFHQPTKIIMYSYTISKKE